MTVAIILGVVIGILVWFSSWSRASSGANRFTLRNPDGSVFGGAGTVGFLNGLVWGGITFGIAFGIASAI